ncbi:hypothetical protein HF086_012045 [Spodoptera exigua]|uniref:Uncharacterized protein n=1 Tax=Spodoptera exigua TaxID=7107 RepID=A0A922MJZ0_SPOEX|nr:hypothetical protein HF086_012045 [Spodoptera exigua]
MRSFIIIAALSALAACYGSAVLPSEEAMQESYTILYDDKSPNGRIMSSTELDARVKDMSYGLLSVWQCDAPAIPGHKQRVNVIYEGSPGIQVLRFGVTPFNPDIEIEFTPFLTNFMQINVTYPVGIKADAIIQMFGIQY